MESGKTGERRFRRLGATPERRADIVDRLAKLDRLLQEIRGKIRALGHTRFRSQSASSTGNAFACVSHSTTFAASRKWF